MKKEYDFSKARKSTYAKQLKNTTLQDVLEKLSIDKKIKIKKRAAKLFLNIKSKE